MRAGAVKRGGGGRFNWGDPIKDSVASAASLDQNDPNYDSMEEPEARRVRNRGKKANGTPVADAPDSEPDAPSGSRAAGDIIANFKRGVTTLLAEYFDSGDINEVGLSLEESGLPRLYHHFVKRALVLSLDRHDREREMISMLLSALYNDVVPADQMQRGFLEAVDAAEDLKLDSPGAVEMLANFVARATVDDILPPAFLARCRDLITPSRGPELPELIKRAEALLTGRHTAERNLRCWGGGAGLLLDETKAAVQSLLVEYLDSRDLGEVDRRLRDLGVPFFHHELVKGALLTVLQNPGTHGGPIKALLASLAASGLISPTQMEKGFQRIVDNLEDIKLDLPSADGALRALMDAAREEGWLDPEFAATPTAAVLTSLSSAGAASGTASDARSVFAFKDRCAAIVTEYFSSADVEEARRCLEELNAEGLHHLFIKKAISMALDRGGRERELVAELISGLFPKTLTRDQAGLGFTMLLDSAEDLSLDVPNALHLISLFLGRAIIMDEVLPPVFLHTVVDRLRFGAAGLDAVSSVAALLGMPHASEMLETCFVSSA